MNETAIKWYRKLGFPEACDKEFYSLAQNRDLSEINQANPVEYLSGKEDYGLNLLYFLAQCDRMQAAFERRKIEKRYFDATIDDIRRGALSCRDVFGVFGLTDPGWYQCLVGGDMLFRIGRFHFSIETAGAWCAGGDIAIGDTISAVHIPQGSHLDDHECYQSFAEAERFILKYFPEHRIKCFMCHSWLLDKGLERFLGENSNIRRFQKLFTLYRRDESDSAIQFVFDKSVTRDNLKDFQTRNVFQESLKKHILEGGKLYTACGMRPVMHEEIKGIDCHYHQMQWFSDDMRSYPESYIPECEDTGSIIEAAQTYMNSCNLQGLNVLCMSNMEDLFKGRDITQNLLGAIAKCENPSVYAHGALIYPEFPAVRDYDFCGQAKRLIDMGFDGIKLIEAKPNAHHKVGLPLSDMSYDKMWAYLEQNRIHVLCHVNDPSYCWDSDKMPAETCYKDRYSHYETIYDQVFQVLDRHPALNITFAHFLFLGYDLQRLADILDRYPNVGIDITPAEEEYVYLSENPAETRAFFARYSDRILFGTDNKNAFSEEFKENKISLIYRFLKTRDEFRSTSGRIRGIRLEKPQLESILYKNFLRRVGSRPKPINREMLKQYMEELFPKLPAGRTADRIRAFYQSL